MQHFGKAALRITKNYTKGYSDTQAKVRDATSNDPWGPSGTQMNEIAQLTYNQNDFIEIMEMLDKRLNDKGKNWRHVFKSLTVLDYCLHQGSENVVIYFRDNIYIVKTLKEFQYVDEDGKDQGANVRQKAKDISNLLTDEGRLREERRARASMRDRMIRGTGGDYGAGDELGLPSDENKVRRQPNGAGGGPSSRRKNVDEDDLRRAIEESKRTLAQEQAAAEDRELQEAIQLSKDEEEKRKHAVDDSNAAALFDDQNQLPSPSNNPFPLLDPTPYAVGLQPQYTVQQQFTSVQPQFTSFNPYQQQMEQEAAQAEYMRQQQAFQQQQLAAQQQQQQQQQQEEWMRQQQMLQMQQQQQQMQQQNLFAQQQLAPQPTGFGSNNPFAPSPVGSPPAQSPVTRSPPSFNLGGTYDSHSPANLSALSGPSPTHTPQPYTNAKPVNVKTKKELGENEAHLAQLFANRDDGQDTFGNIGALRYGQTDAGRHVIAQRTGATSAASSHNPFAKQTQNTDQPFFNV